MEYTTIIKKVYEMDTEVNKLISQGWEPYGYQVVVRLASAPKFGERLAEAAVVMQVMTKAK